MIADGRSIMNLSGIDGDRIARTRLDLPTAAGGDLRAMLDDPDTELVMRMPGKPMIRLRRHRLHAGDRAPEQSKFALFPCRHSAYPFSASIAAAGAACNPLAEDGFENAPLPSPFPVYMPLGI